ncbi:hypothetical protein [Streptomyces sp. CB03911]|uniref:hypothetical protein n=1 Tax=Streptomyces sp. CB03911 TaxID=1804758 RepID=UPI0018FE945D|nr:hypothetical protein [Streptomyces sp. CB03911]
MTYDGSLPPADGREYYWSNHTNRWELAPVDAHADCIEPHRTADGYANCDGRPL